ncbi:hypothetical protein L596_023229 [Steinernema carpocapsae]|uniref:Uncharacterized protein n=1 Tax=Steinernema carpocapsae TaxID=34508 RepID=A0A4U5MDU0_STECR|nr:hypothetical protein L596_023229 [Steinernema carpocapsae]
MDKTTFGNYLAVAQMNYEMNPSLLLPKEHVAFVLTLTGDDYDGLKAFVQNQRKTRQEGKKASLLKTWSVVEKINEDLYDRGTKFYIAFMDRVMELPPKAQYLVITAQEKSEKSLDVDAISMWFIIEVAKLDESEQDQMDVIFPGLKNVAKQFAN